MEQTPPRMRLPSSPLGPPCLLSANGPTRTSTPKQGATTGLCQLSLSPTTASSDSTQMWKKAR